MYFFVQILDMT